MSSSFDIPDWDLEEFVPDEFLGEAEDTVYIKREIMNFRPVFVVYDSQGQPLAHATTREAAIALAERADLTPHPVN